MDEKTVYVVYGTTNCYEDEFEPIGVFQYRIDAEKCMLSTVDCVITNQNEESDEYFTVNTIRYYNGKNLVGIVDGQNSTFKYYIKEMPLL